MSQRIGKCTNYANCKLAYRNEKIVVNTKDFRCPECGSPLENIESTKHSYGLAAIIASSILLVLLIIGVMIWTHWLAMDQNQGTPPAMAIPAPTLLPTPVPTPMPTPLPTPVPTPIPVPTPTPVPVSSDHLDNSAADLAKLKAEVAKRIDLMPDLSEARKEMLFASLAKAKGIKLVTTVSFKSAKQTLSTIDQAAIKASLSEPAVSSLLGDPSVVFVVLGYASKSGSNQLNMKLSQDRANSVMNELQLDCQVRNALYSLPMGESTLFGKDKLIENQVAEIWIVLP
jgi:outer membrane protein OmpA-like peptidoglycan-associated protein